MKFTLLFALILSLLSAYAVSAADNSPRTKDGAPITGFYYFTHWWEPWRSDDARILKDLKEIKAMGCNTIFLDSEWSQAIDNDYKWLDRGHRLAKEAGLEILPWLSLKEWIDLGEPARIALIKKMYGVDLVMGIDYDGEPNRVLPYGEATIEAGYRYCDEYLQRYLNSGAILRIKDGNKLKPVIAITVELEWGGSNDETSCKMFRDYLKQKYSYISKLNKAWKTNFKSINDIQLMDPKLFDAEAYIEGKSKYPRAVEDQIAFRAKVQNDSMAEIKRRLKIKYPDLIIATELPYEMFSDHLHARYYTINGAATPETTLHAEINVLRCTGYLPPKTVKALKEWRAKTGQKLIITYRTYGDAALDMFNGKNDFNYDKIGKQAADAGDGFGFYSWNEMVDTHLSAEPDYKNPYNPDQRVSKEEEAAWKALASQQIREYLNTAK